MKNIINPKLILVLLTYLIIDIVDCQTVLTKTNTQETINQNIENEKIQQLQNQQQFKKQIQQQLHEWIISEINFNLQDPDIQPTQSAMFILNHEALSKYKIPAANQNNKLVKISVFEIGQNGEITLPQNPSEQNFVEIFLANQKNDVMYSRGKVYIQKTFEIKFNSKQIFLNIKNHASITLIIGIDIEQQERMIDLVLKDEQFALTHNKIASILQETKGSQVNRQHQYKWQWGFYEKVKRHEIDMLGFTIAELIIILGTSIVQIYCIKNLVNEELII